MAAEHNRKSLVDDFDSAPAAKGKKVKSGGSGNGVKVGIIVVCLVAAAVLLGYNFGIIPNPFAEKPKPQVFTPEDNQAIQDYKQQAEKRQNAPNAPVVGGE